MKSFSLNIRGHLRQVDKPLIMGILNVTPDSFYSGSRTPADDRAAILDRASRLIAEGADIVDIGGYSSRPGAAEVSPEEEGRRVRAGIEAVRSLDPDILISIDTFRADVARSAIEDWGADIINDISAGMLDREMIPVVARLGVPYIIMHTRGTPSTMSSLTDYPYGVVAGVASELHERILECHRAGIADLIVDPGFGFAKTAEQNYRLMASLRDLSFMLDDLPMLVGVSRKSMIYKPLGITPADSLPGTDALNTLALIQGAAILRVHDVAAARQVLDVVSMFRAAEKTPIS